MPFFLCFTFYYQWNIKSLMINIIKYFFLFFLFFSYGCNQNKSEEEMKELWGNAQTTGEIINRSGTVFNPAIDKDLALSDAETRLQTGGGLFGKKGLTGSIIGGKKEGKQVTTVGMPINTFLWRASLDTINFMPLSSADPFGGIIITDWYSTQENENERCKLNIFINGSELKTKNLKVASFCQLFRNQKWVNAQPDYESDMRLENAILNKAKKLKLQNS